MGLLDDPAKDVSNLTQPMCQKFYSTNFWQRWMLGGQVNKTAEADGLPPPSHDPTAGSAVPPPPGNVSVDLLPALYMVGPALPDSCTAEMLAQTGLPDTAALAKVMMAALQRCRLLEEEPAEASRCLFGMPLLGISTNNATVIKPTVQALLAWFFNPTGKPQRRRWQPAAGLAARDSQRCAPRALAAPPRLPPTPAPGAPLPQPPPCPAG